jgi:UDP-N-acetylmuramoylalanine--D-glutamate ligase
VADVEGVRFYNDSKATTVDSVVRALECFDDPILLLAGGKDKGGSFEPLRDLLGRRVRRLFLYGAAAGRMERELGGYTAVERAEDLEQAVARAWRAARPGDVVLLSPACSSFDMFRDYEDRGRRFKDLVRSLGQESGPKE